MKSSDLALEMAGRPAGIAIHGSPDPARVTIKAIHHCSTTTESGLAVGELYVQRTDGLWYWVIRHGEVHCFAEVGNWSEDTWMRHLGDPPCCRSRT